MEHQDIVTGIVPLTLTQNWAITTKYSRYIPFLLEYPYKVDADTLIKTLQYIHLRHDILRMRLISESNRWQQIIPYPDEVVPLTWVSLMTHPRQEHPAIIRETAISLYKELDRYEGPLIRFVCFERENNASSLLLVIVHHLIFDGYSSIVLFDEFSTIYHSIYTNEAISLSPKPPSFKRFAEEIAQYTQSHLIQEFEEYWSPLPWEKMKPLPADYSEEQILQTTDSWCYIHQSWSPEETDELLQARATTRIPLLDILLGALALTVAQWTNGPFAHIITTDTGRPMFSSLLNLNLSHTIGYLAVNRRLFLDVPDTRSIKAAFQSILNQINAIPHKGLGSDLIYYSSPKDENIRKRETFIWSKEHILLNFAGIKKYTSGVSASWHPSEEYQDVDLSWESTSFIEHPNKTREQPRTYRALYYGGAIANNQMHFRLGFDKTIYKQETVEHIYQDFKKNIKNILYYIKI